MAGCVRPLLLSVSGGLLSSHSDTPLALALSIGGRPRASHTLASLASVGMKPTSFFTCCGGTYFDTAFVYHEGASEKALKEALVKRYPRDAYTVATKCLAWAAPSVAG